MTVPTDINRQIKNGNGVTTVFSYGFKIFEEGDEVITLFDASGVPTVQTLNVDYTVSNITNSAFTVTMVVAPASGEQLVGERKLAETQDIDLVRNDPLPAETLEEGYDRATMLIQELFDLADRSLVQQANTTITGLEIPAPASLELWRWNSAADALETVAVASIGLLTLPVGIPDGGTGATTAVGARANLGAIAAGDDIDFTGDNTYAAKQVFNAEAEFNAVVQRGDGSELTISSGSVTPTSNYHVIDTEADAASDILTTIVTSALNPGTILRIRQAVLGRTVIVQNGSGSDTVATADGANVTLDTLGKYLDLQLDVGGQWREVGRSEVVTPNPGGAVEVLSEALPPATSDEVTGIDISGFERIVISVDEASLSSSGGCIVEFGDATDYTTGVVGNGTTTDESGVTALNWSADIALFATAGAGTNLSGGAVLHRLPDTMAEDMFGVGYIAWHVQVNTNQLAGSADRNHGGGIFATNKTVDRIRISASASFDNGRWGVTGYNS